MKGSTTGQHNGEEVKKVFEKFEIDPKKLSLLMEQQQ